jgi:hypothetical protein
MSDLGVQDAAAEADDTVNPAFLAASMIDEHSSDAPSKSSTSPGWTVNRNSSR